MEDDNLRPKQKSKTVKYILYKEKNGWEQETWLTFIPRDGNKADIALLLRACKLSNAIASQWDQERKGERAKKDEQKRQFYASYGMPAPTPVHLGSTYFEVDTKRVYTKDEANEIVDSTPSSYMTHAIMDHPNMGPTAFEQLQALVKDRDGKDIYQLLYKGGIAKLF